MESAFLWKVSGEVDGLPTTASGKASSVEMALFDANHSCNQLALRGVIARITNITVDAVPESNDRRFKFEEDWDRIITLEPKPVGARFGALNESGNFFWYAEEPLYREDDCGWFSSGHRWSEPAVRFLVTDYWNRCYLSRMPSGRWVTQLTYCRDRVRAAYQIVDLGKARS
jgi:hypothetical protein